MISRFEFLYIREKIKKIENILFEYEATSPIFQAWDKYIHLTLQEKEEIDEKWNKYYEDCKNSFWGKAFFWLKNNRISRKIVEFLNGEAKKREIKLIEKPDNIDPYELRQKIGAYYSLKNELDSLKKVYEEYKGVYETKKDKLDELLD